MITFCSLYLLKWYIFIDFLVLNNLTIMRNPTYSIYLYLYICVFTYFNMLINCLHLFSLVFLSVFLEDTDLWFFSMLSFSCLELRLYVPHTMSWVAYLLFLLSEMFLKFDRITVWILNLLWRDTFTCVQFFNAYWFILVLVIYSFLENNPVLFSKLLT